MSISVKPSHSRWLSKTSFLGNRNCKRSFYFCPGPKFLFCNWIDENHWQWQMLAGRVSSRRKAFHCVLSSLPALALCAWTGRKTQSWLRWSWTTCTQGVKRDLFKNKTTFLPKLPAWKSQYSLFSAHSASLWGKFHWPAFNSPFLTLSWTY